MIQGGQGLPPPGRPALQRAMVAIGASAGGLRALGAILGELAADFALPILLVQHLHPHDDGRFARHLGTLTPMTVVVPCDKEPIRPGHMYVAPADYHMLVERDGTIALSIDEKVCHSRPSIDVLFESAAHALGPRLVAVILSGASNDGTRGMCAVRALGGHTMAQDPACAEFPVMPLAAIEAGGIASVLSLHGLAEALSEIGRGRAPGGPARA